MRVVVTDRRFPEIDDPYGNVVRDAGGEIEYHDFETVEEVAEGCKDADVVVTFSAPMTREAIEAMEQARVIIRQAAGVDVINLAAASERGIPVSNTPGAYCADELSTHAIGLMIAAAHEVAYSDRLMRENDGWGHREDINPMNGGTFGVVGLGHVGRATVPKARGLDMDVIASDPFQSDDIFADLDVERVGIDELLARADCVSIHTPLTADTRGMFSTDEFAAMKETAVLVNTARGPIVDERALVDAIESGELFSAGLDVFEVEPPNGTPALSCDRIVCSPHHGGNCARSHARRRDLIRAELRRALTGEHLRHVVNADVLHIADDRLSPKYREE